MHDHRDQRHDDPGITPGAAPDDALDAADVFAVRVAGPLRDAEPADPMLRARVLATIRAEREAPAHAVTTARVARPDIVDAAGAPWWRRRFTLRLTPVSGLALAAGIAAIALVGAEVLRDAPSGAAPAEMAQARVPAARTDTVHVVRFVLVAPEAASVALVGDFNGWDRTAVQLTREAEAAGVWTAAVPIPAGRHEYAFLVDGERWMADPTAPARLEDEFGVESSIVIVEGSGRAAASRT